MIRMTINSSTSVNPFSCRTRRRIRRWTALGMSCLVRSTPQGRDQRRRSRNWYIDVRRAWCRASRWRGRLDELGRQPLPRRLLPFLGVATGLEDTVAAAPGAGHLVRRAAEPRDDASRAAARRAHAALVLAGGAAGPGTGTRTGTGTGAGTRAHSAAPSVRSAR